MAENSVGVVGSPNWWMNLLTERLTKRTRDIEINQAYLDNDPPLPEGAPNWQPTYQAFHKSTRTNFASLIVESARERMTPVGFRTGASNDENGDELAAEIWATNEMPVEQVDLLSWMLGLGVGYTMVGPDPDRGRIPLITAEDPRQTITAHDPARRSKVRAGMKLYHDPEEDLDVCFIYVPPDPKHHPSRVTAYRATRKTRRGLRPLGGDFQFRAGQWVWDEPMVMPTTRVPITRFLNRNGQSEFWTHIPLLDRLNRAVLQRLLISDLQAFRQRAVKGLPRHYPEDFYIAELRGKEIEYGDMFLPGPGSLWQVPEGVDFWESQALDIRPIVDAEQHDIRTLAALTRMPVSYFNPDDANGSAEGASLQREGLVYRVEDRQTLAEAGLEATLSHAFEMMGETQRAEMAKIDTIWAPIERLSLSEMYSAASQGRAAGLASATIRREILKFTPKQLTMAEDDDTTDALLGRVQPVPVTGAQPGQPVRPDSRQQPSVGDQLQQGQGA